MKMLQEGTVKAYAAVGVDTAVVLAAVERETGAMEAAVNTAVDTLEAVLVQHNTGRSDTAGYKGSLSLRVVERAAYANGMPLSECQSSAKSGSILSIVLAALIITGAVQRAGWYDGSGITFGPNAVPYTGPKKSTAAAKLATTTTTRSIRPR